MENEIIHGDCLRVLCQVPSNSVDCVICDLPYGQTQNKWDSTLPLSELWAQYNRICKQNAAVILFGQGMFTGQLMQSNSANWRYNLVWQKDRVSGFLNANRMPLRSHEDIVVFYRKQPVYNPQKWVGKPEHSTGKRNGNVQRQSNYGKCFGTDNAGNTMKHPRSVLFFKRPHPPVHPTQKPVKLYEWLVKSYTHEGALVLDNCSGSGTCAIACISTNRRYICIESESSYYEMSVKRAAEKAEGVLTSDNTASMPLQKAQQHT